MKRNEKVSNFLSLKRLMMPIHVYNINIGGIFTDYAYNKNSVK